MLGWLRKEVAEPDFVPEAPIPEPEPIVIPEPEEPEPYPNPPEPYDHKWILFNWWEDLTVSDPFYHRREELVCIK